MAPKLSRKTKVKKKDQRKPIAPVEKGRKLKGAKVLLPSKIHQEKWKKGQVFSPELADQVLLESHPHVIVNGHVFRPGIGAVSTGELLGKVGSVMVVQEALTFSMEVLAHREAVMAPWLREDLDQGVNPVKWIHICQGLSCHHIGQGDFQIHCNQIRQCINPSDFIKECVVPEAEAPSKREA